MRGQTIELAAGKKERAALAALGSPARVWITIGILVLNAASMMLPGLPTAFIVLVLTLVGTVYNTAFIYYRIWRYRRVGKIAKVPLDLVTAWCRVLNATGVDGHNGERNHAELDDQFWMFARLLPDWRLACDEQYPWDQRYQLRQAIVASMQPAADALKAIQSEREAIEAAEREAADKLRRDHLADRIAVLRPTDDLPS